MPREPRLFLPSVPCHVVARGHNRDVCFCSNQDHYVYLNYLFESCAKLNIALHAYVLMSNHVHLLVTPLDRASVSQLMHLVSGRYSGYFNKKYNRSGSLWDGRFRASMIDSEHYLLACYRYIELNPVRAAMVFHPADYRWSSYHVNGRGKSDPNITAHDLYKSLGPDTQERATAYRKLVALSLPSQVVSNIRQASACSKPLGNNRFSKQIARLLKKIK